MADYVIRVQRSMSADLQRYWVSIVAGGNHEPLFRSEMLLDKGYAEELAVRMATDLGIDPEEIVVEDHPEGPS